jgi:hypothetical protein
MKQKFDSVRRKGRIVVLAGLASLMMNCASSQPKTFPQKPVEASNSVNLVMNPVFFSGKSLKDYFKQFNSLSPDQQENAAKSLNNLSIWETILLARYVPIDGTLGNLSSFYTTDYKAQLDFILSTSLDPRTTGLGGDKGLGQLSLSSEKWARDLYNNKKLRYEFPGAKITANSFDPYTNLVLSSILFRKASEEKVLDLDALMSVYNQGFGGVTLDKDGFYVVNDLGAKVANRIKAFDSIADKLILFSWVSMNRPDLNRFIEDPSLRNVIDANNEAYEGKSAYEGMISFLNSTSANTRKYSDENRKMFKNEIANMSSWIKILYGDSK